MILNELSIHSGTVNQKEINEMISEFLKICHKIFLEKGDMNFYYTAALMTNELIPGYTLHDWFQNSQVPQREKAFFRTMINRRQLIKEQDFLGSELLVETDEGQQVNAVGCLMAYELESYVVSMRSSIRWQGNRIEGCYISLEDDDRCVSVTNCCREEQLELLASEQKKKLMRTVSSGRELWEKRGELYPHLLFCGGVKKQLEEARIALHIQIIMKRLQVLEDYFRDFNGQFDKNKMGYRCRDESETVENNAELRRLRTFVTPYGNEEFFTWHISFAGNFPGRIHFVPDAEHKVGIVGYIGKHLPTGKFSTI